MAHGASERQPGCFMPCASLDMFILRTWIAFLPLCLAMMKCRCRSDGRTAPGMPWGWMPLIAIDTFTWKLWGPSQATFLVFQLFGYRSKKSYNFTLIQKETKSLPKKNKTEHSVRLRKQEANFWGCLAISVYFSSASICPHQHMLFKFGYGRICKVRSSVKPLISYANLW